MKEAYAWWTMQFIEGLYTEANSDLLKASENMRTIVVLAARKRGEAAAWRDHLLRDTGGS